jgi:inner membrane protein
MLILGHVGITLGVAVLSLGALNKGGQLPATAKKTARASEPPPQMPTTHNYPNRNKISWFTSAASYIDFRFLLLGSLLPDIIDKPIGIYLFPEIFGSGRIFCHTLLFTVLLTLAGLYLFRRDGKTWLLALTFGVFMHFILDQMWLYPKTLLWPAFGIAFDKTSLENWLGNILVGLFTNPEVFIPELVGAAILIWFAVVLVHRKKVCAFIKYGQA